MTTSNNDDDCPCDPCDGIARGRSLRDDESVVAWFYRLLRNVMIDHLRRQSAEDRGRAAFAREESAAADAEPDQELVDTICACVTSLVDTLRPDYAAAIQRVDLGGESLQSFATTSPAWPPAASLWRSRR